MRFRLPSFGRSEPAPSASRAVRAEVDYAVLEGPGYDGFLRGHRSASGAVVNAETAMRVATVYRCVGIIAGAIATLPCHLMRERDGRKSKAKDHPLYRLLKKRPNRWQTASGFRKMMQAHVLLRGNAYAVKVRTGARITALLPLHPDRVDPVQLPDLTLIYKYRHPAGHEVVFPAEEIFHLRDLSTDGVKGLSRIALAREALGLAVQTERFGGAVFRNGAYPGAALKSNSSLSDDAFARLKQQIEEHRAGVDNAHKTLILEEGMDWTTLGLTAEDAQFLETRKFQRGEIATFFGVPPHLIGDTEKSSSWGTGIAEQNFGFVQFTLLEHITEWEQATDRDLLTEAESVADELFLHLSVKGWLRATPEKQAEVYAKALGAGGHRPWMTVDEIRDLEDLNPFGGESATLQAPLNTAAPAASSPSDNPEPRP